MAQQGTDGLAAQIAILIASRRAGDRLGERVARRRLEKDYGVRLAFSRQSLLAVRRTLGAGSR